MKALAYVLTVLTVLLGIAAVSCGFAAIWTTGPLQDHLRFTAFFSGALAVLTAFGTEIAWSEVQP